MFLFRLTAAVEGGWYDKLAKLQPTTQDLTRADCQNEQFQCITTGECVPADYLCDMYPDCEDGSDEYNAQCSECI